MKKYTEEQLMKAIESAYHSGRLWAETYQGWFTPNRKDNEKNFQEAVRDALEYIAEMPHDPSP